ncbi:MAG TPA: sigma-54 dependent transcriptional regulator, partial [Candidatus Binatia bacterium]|nr:sigma-54 dependent transcriptional regulator [Candidatus Binatia bacterium]
HDVVGAADLAAAEAVLAAHDVDLVISDLRMPGGSGLDLLDVAHACAGDTPVIVLTAYGTVETAVEAMHKGAFDYLLKPFDAGEIELRIARALALRRYRLENAYLREEIEGQDGLDELIGVSGALGRVVELIKQVAPAKTSVLITGETGTGKELVARAIHRRSPRAEGLLVPVNLAAVPLELLESELFGHARGAFTGAVAERVGKLELAHAGTLFLDEIADAPRALQPKILRVLQDGVVERVGSNQRREVDVRVISATNRNLDDAVAAGEFRADLYYRLRVIEIRMPALRERREDIRYLTAHFLRRFGERRPGGIPRITEAALRLLEDYHWPGNVRELENVIERAVVLCERDVVGADLVDLRRAEGSARDQLPGLRLDEALDHLEREMILRALEETKQVKARAARLLGISERSLWYKLRKHGLS